jgi:hypothetical protein
MARINCGQKARFVMLWMERFALIIFIITNLFLFGFNLILRLISPEYNFNIHDSLNYVIFSAIFAAIFWALFRSIDYIFGGPLRREIRRTENYIQRAKNSY